MRKITPLIVIAGLLIVSSCAKNPAQNPGGSWTFEQNTYSVSTCTGSSTASDLIASGSSSVSPGSVTISFLSYPTANGTYIDTVSAGAIPSQANRIGISATVGNSAQQASYVSTGGNGIETVFVTVANGKITVTGSGLEMKNTSIANPADSAAIEFDITQLQ